MSQRGFIPVLVIILIAIFFIGGYLAYQQVNKSSFTPPPNQIACTQDAKLCPDGTAVGRSGPNCEFSPCPTPKEASSSADTSKLKIYRSEKYKFEVKIPEDWEADEDEYGLVLGKVIDVNHIGEKVPPYVSSGLWLNVELKTANDTLQNSARRLLDCGGFDSTDQREFTKINGKEVIILRISPCGVTAVDTLLWMDDKNFYLLQTYNPNYGGIDSFLSTFRFLP